MLTTIYLIRHSEKMQLPHEGVSRYLLDRIQPLSVNGERKAKGLLEVPELRGAVAAYCSPFARTASTLRYLSTEDKLPLFFDERLRELDFGDVPGMEKMHSPPKSSDKNNQPEKPNAKANGPGDFQSRQWEDRDLAATNGESLNQCAARMKEAVLEIAAAHPDQKVLVGSHGAALCAFLSAYMPVVNHEYTGALPQPALFRMDVTDGNITEVRRLPLPPAARNIPLDVQGKPIEIQSLFRHTRNTRPLARNSTRYIRSDKPVVLEQDEIDRLLKQDIRTVVDLRAEWEQTLAPCPLASNPDFLYLSMPTTASHSMPKIMGGNNPPMRPDKSVAHIKPEHMPKLPARTLDSYISDYIRMTDTNMVNIVKTIEASQHGVLYFCGAGKDRTGVVSALLMLRMGYTDEAIIADYTLSTEYLHEMLIEDEQRDAAMSAAVNAPNAYVMRSYLAQIRPKLNELFDN